MGPARLGCGGAPGHAEPFSGGSCCLCPPPQSWQSWKKGDLKPLCALPRGCPCLLGPYPASRTEGPSLEQPLFWGPGSSVPGPSPPSLHFPLKHLHCRDTGRGTRGGMGLHRREWGYRGGDGGTQVADWGHAPCTGANQVVLFGCCTASSPALLPRACSLLPHLVLCPTLGQIQHPPPSPHWGRWVPASPSPCSLCSCASFFFFFLKLGLGERGDVGGDQNQAGKR